MPPKISSVPPKTTLMPATFCKLKKRKTTEPVNYDRYLEHTMVIDIHGDLNCRNGVRLEYCLENTMYCPFLLILDSDNSRYSLERNSDLWDFEIMSKSELEAITTLEQLHDKLKQQIKVYNQTNNDDIYQDMFQTVLEIFEITKQ